MNVDLSKAATLVGVVGALAGSATTYGVLQYRVGELEERVRELREGQAEATCLVCDVHDLKTCPGCR